MCILVPRNCPMYIPLFYLLPLFLITIFQTLYIGKLTIDIKQSRPRNKKKKKKQETLEDLKKDSQQLSGLQAELYALCQRLILTNDVSQYDTERYEKLLFDIKQRGAEPAITVTGTKK